MGEVRLNFMGYSKKRRTGFKCTVLASGRAILKSIRRSCLPVTERSNLRSFTDEVTYVPAEFTSRLGRVIQRADATGSYLHREYTATFEAMR